MHHGGITLGGHPQRGDHLLFHVLDEAQKKLSWVTLGARATGAVAFLKGTEACTANAYLDNTALVQMSSVVQDS